MPTNNFVPVAAAAGSNVTTDASWNGSSFQSTGVQKGIVPSAGMNKAWRQGTMGASALGQIIVDHGLIDAVDDGSVTNLKANLRMSIAAMLAGSAFAVDQSTTANVLTVVLDPVPPALTGFRGIFVRVANTNTGPVSLTLNNLGSKGVVRKNGLALVAGDILAGQFVHLLYDAVAGQWVASGSLSSDSTAQAQAAKSIFNVVPFSNTTRTSMSTTGANVLVTPWSGFSYTKKSATSNVLIFGNFQNFTPSSAAGCTRVRFSVGNTNFDSGVSNGYTQSVSGAPSSIALGNSPVVRLAGVPIGSQACALSFFRPDASPWTTVFNPNSSDTADYPAVNTATLIFAEVEPS